MGSRANKYLIAITVWPSRFARRIKRDGKGHQTWFFFILRWMTAIIFNPECSCSRIVSEFGGRSSRAGNNPERFRGCEKLPELFAARNRRQLDRVVLRRRFLVLNERPCESIAIGSEARPFFKLAADLSSIFKERAEIAGRVLESGCRSSLRASINPLIRSRCLYLPRRVRMRCLALDFLLSVFRLLF
jgi:hypothetical protein